MALPNLNDIYKKSVQAPTNSFGSQNSSVVARNLQPYNVGNTVPGTNMPPPNATPAEYSKYLYDSGLQNVFNDYQQNISTLNQQEQNRLQEAYQIREMSKRYLGEYASNLGIGDVSGNLLQIYGDYQKNIGEISQQSDLLALNLQQTYQAESQRVFQESLRTMDVQLQENAQTVLFNISKNDIGDMSWDEYLQSQLDSGFIDQSSYQTIYTNVYGAKVEEFQSAFTSNFFGFERNANGELVPLNPQQYLEKNREWLTPQDFQRFSDLISYEAQKGGTSFTLMPDVPNFVKAFASTDSTFVMSSTSNGQTVYYAAIADNVDNDSEANTQVTTQELTEDFKEKYPGSILQSGATVHEYGGNFYVFMETATGGTWNRLQNATQYAKMFEGLTKDKEKLWTLDGTSNKTLTNEFFTFTQGNNLESHTLKAMDANFVIDKDWAYHSEKLWPGNVSTDLNENGTLKNYPSSWSQDLKPIREKFIQIHGADAKEGIVFYEGSFYYVGSNGKIAKFKRA
jgi:hypothetical protein